MKKRISIVFMALSTIILLMLAIIPHHHHQGFWCNEVELCVEDNGVNDEHTHHSDDHTSCVEKLNYVPVKYVISKPQSQHSNHLYLSLVAIISLFESYEQNKVQICYFISNKKYSNSYLLNPNQLRAPPQA